MISKKKLTSRGAGGSRGLSHYLTTEYYVSAAGAEGGTVWWSGGASAALGLHDGMTVEQMRGAMERLAQGYHPTDNNPDGSPGPIALVQNAGKEGQQVVVQGPDGKPLLKADGTALTEWSGTRTMGTDLCYSPPKAFSLLYAMSDATVQQKLRIALAEANARGMDYMEQHALTQVGSGEKGTLRKVAARVVRSSHMHFASRELDADLHVHNLVFTPCQDVATGRWHALDTEGMLANRMNADRVANAHLAALVQSLGYGVEAVALIDAQGAPTSAKAWTLKGMPRDMEMAFSKRRAAILDYVQQHPDASTNSAALATRPDKNEPTLAELTRMWSTELDEYGRAHGVAVTADAYRTTQQPTAPDWRAWDMNTFVGSFLDNNRSAGTWTRQSLEAEVAMWCGAARVDTVQRITDEIAREHFRTIGGRTEDRAQYKDRQALFVPHVWDRWERDIQDIAHDSLTDRTHAIGHDVADRAMAAFEQEQRAKTGISDWSLLDEQRAAIRSSVCDSGAATTVSGLSGTGKTTTSAVSVRLWKDAGLRAIGVSTSEAATRKLVEDSGIDEAYNGAMLLLKIKHGQITLDNRSVLLIDEAGMSDTRQMHALLSAAHQAGAKVVMMGDTRQLQSVSGGGPFSMVRGIVGGATLRHVRRQKGQSLEITKLLYGVDADGNMLPDAPKHRTADEARAHGAQVMAAMRTQGMVTMTAEHDQAVQLLAQRYVSSSVPLEQRIVLAHTHTDRRALNSAIRPLLRDRGTLTGTEHDVTTAGGQVYAVAVGERIVFQKNMKLDKRPKTLARVAQQRAMLAGDAVALAAFDATHPPPGTWAALTAPANGKAQPTNQIDITNGLEAVVEAIRSEQITDATGAQRTVHRITARIHSDDARHGARLTWRSDAVDQWGHAYAMTVHKSQGQTKDLVLHLANGSATNEAVLVGYTRWRTNEGGAYHVAGDADSINALEQYAIGRFNQAQNVVDIECDRAEALSVPEEQGVGIPMDRTRDIDADDDDADGDDATARRGIPRRQVSRAAEEPSWEDMDIAANANTAWPDFDAHDVDPATQRVAAAWLQRVMSTTHTPEPTAPDAAPAAMPAVSEGSHPQNDVAHSEGITH